jgi:DNA repair protein RecN (Recombination protein N)
VLRDYLDSIEADPEALEKTAERLFLIGDLKRKYGESIAEVLSYASAARHRLGEIEHRAERLATLDARVQELTDELASAASALSRRRQTAAAQLAGAVQSELEDLRLSGARFQLALTQTDDPDGVPVSGHTLAVDQTGVDRAEFLLAANGGDELRPMARVASGGELARIALALKTVLSRAETRPTLIFDEIDVGVGGRTGPVVGEKLAAIASAGHQVLCVTHMPQVAAFADAHYVVARSMAGAGSEVTELDADRRLDELAAMLAGTATTASRESARELLARARPSPRGRKRAR